MVNFLPNFGVENKLSTKFAIIQIKPENYSVLPDENFQKGPKAKILKNKKDRVPDFFRLK